MVDRYAVFTKHAHERLRECQLSISKAAWLLYNAKEEYLYRDQKKRKASKYAQKALHLRNGTYIFTLLPAKDKYTKEPIYLVLSVFDQRISL